MVDILVVSVFLAV